MYATAVLVLCGILLCSFSLKLKAEVVHDSTSDGSIHEASGFRSDDLRWLRKEHYRAHHHHHRRRDEHAKQHGEAAPSHNQDTARDIDGMVASLTYLFEAENTNVIIKHGKRGSTFKGYSGTGYANLRKKKHSSVVFQDVVVKTTGYYQLVFRYSARESSGRSCYLEVNGYRVGSLQFLGSGKWTAWSSETVEKVFLRAEEKNRIRVTSYHKGPNLDFMQIASLPDIRGSEKPLQQST